MSWKRVVLIAIALGALAVHALAQTAEIPRRTVPYSWSSGPHDGDQLLGHFLAAREIVTVPGSPWMQIRFAAAELGSASYLELVSLADGARQRLDADELHRWRHHSAYFNGDAVELALFVGAGDRGVRLEIEAVVGGEWAFGTKSICGVDDRVASNEQRVARIDPIGCTGWIASNGKLLSAGHCLAGGASNQTLSFNVPASLPDGTVQFPGPQDQYAIDLSSFQFVNGGIGNDWGIFRVFNNGTTGLQPIQAQGGGFSVRRDLGPANIRITGFGVDSGVTNQTNQTEVGPNAGSSGTIMRYVTDTTGGNSGSPVIDEATGDSVGIHTHAGCSAGGGNNHGTSFINAALWNAFNTEVAFASGTAVGNQGTVNGFRTIAFGEQLGTPIVVMGPPSFNGSQPTAVRVRNVTSTNFQYQIEEWDYLDGTHVSENIGFLAVEAGRSSLGGLDIEASAVNINHNWTTVGFSSPITPAPVVVAQTVTRNGGQAVTTRIRNVTTTSFQVRLHEEEANDGSHAVETVHWIALQPGNGTSGGVTVAAGRTGNSVTHLFAGIGFGTTVASTVLLADMQTFDGGDTAALRHQSLTTTSVQIKVEEEQSGDPEVNHTTEVIGWIAIGDD